MLFIELLSRRLDGSILLLSRIILHHSLYFPPVSLCKVVILHSHLLRDLIFWSVSAHLYFPFLQTPIIFFFLTLSCNHFPCFSAPTSPSTSLLPPPSPISSLIVMFSAEGYSCLQGYGNVRKAHSIFCYVNSHFPPEQTHFSRV